MTGNPPHLWGRVRATASGWGLMTATAEFWLHPHLTSPIEGEGLRADEA